MTKIAVFLDRDGTINDEVGYINHESRLKLLPNSGKAIKLFNDNDILVIVCTNQAGIARGYFKESLVQTVNNKMKDLLKLENAFVDDIYYCPHHPTVGPIEYRMDCNCRKPKTGMIEKAASIYDIDIKNSYVVGDKMTDVMWGSSIGAKSILVLTGYGMGEYVYEKNNWKNQPSYIADDLYKAATWIIEDIKSK